jgi:hypothetical protein
METKKEIDMNMVTGLMDETYSLLYVDYRTDLRSNLDCIAKCLEAKNCSALFDRVDEWCDDNRDTSVTGIMEDLKKELVRMGYKKWEAEKFFEENDEDIRSIIYSRDDSDPLPDLLRNTDKIPVRIELLSVYDCINSHWLESDGGYGYDSSYFGDMVDALNLNPYEVEKVLLAHGEKVTGYFPDKRSRNGKEQVSYESFYEELENACCGANLLTYTARMDSKEFVDSAFHFTEIIIPKGNKCGLYSSMQGGGSLMEMELKEDVKLSVKAEGYPRFRLEVEQSGNGYDYSIGQTYGVDDSFFGKPLRILSHNLK